MDELLVGVLNQIRLRRRRREKRPSGLTKVQCTIHTQHTHNKVQSDLRTASPNCPALPVNNAVNHVGWDAFRLATRRLTFFYPTRYLRYILHKYICISLNDFGTSWAASLVKIIFSRGEKTLYTFINFLDERVHWQASQLQLRRVS